MADRFRPGELARVKVSHHKSSPKGSIVKVVRQFQGRLPGNYYVRGRWITFEPLIKRGSKDRYTWDENKFEKL